MKRLFSIPASISMALLWLIGCTTASRCMAQSEAPLPPATPESSPRPAIQLLRFDENWKALCNPSLRMEGIDRVKCLSLPMISKDAYLSIGGEFRGTYEDVLNDNWSDQPYPVNSFGLERLQLFGDTHFNAHLRLFLQLESGLEQGRPGGPRPIDRKDLDFLNAFLDLSRGDTVHGTRLRVGRQELQFGSGRLVAVREGPNVRQGFYGARVTQYVDRWTVDGFAARPAADKPGFFDDAPTQTTSFWGIFAERNLGGNPTRAFDAYYFGLDRKSAVFNQGTGREQRQTLGARIASAAPLLDDHRPVIPHYDLEAVYQFGKFGSGSIRAWTIASESGMTLGKLVFRPRIGLRADAASGDKDSTDRNLQTFNPLFPIGNYFGVISDTGPGPVNFYDLHPNVHCYFAHHLNGMADWLLYWRQSVADGVYGVPGNLLVSSGQSRAHFVGHRPGLELRWQRDAHFYVQGDYAVFFSGPFLRESAKKQDLNYASLWVGYKF